MAMCATNRLQSTTSYFSANTDSERIQHEKSGIYFKCYGNCDQVMIVVTTCPRHRSRIIKIHIGVETAYRQIDKIMIELFKVIS